MISGGKVKQPKESRCHNIQAENKLVWKHSSYILMLNYFILKMVYTCNYIDPEYMDAEHIFFKSGIFKYYKKTKNNNHFSFDRYPNDVIPRTQ